MTATRLNPEYASKSGLSTLEGAAVMSTGMASSYNTVGQFKMAYSKAYNRLYVFDMSGSVLASFNCTWHA